MWPFTESKKKRLKRIEEEKLLAEKAALKQLEEEKRRQGEEAFSNVITRLHTHIVRKLRCRLELTKDLRVVIMLPIGRMNPTTDDSAALFLHQGRVVNPHRPVDLIAKYILQGKELSFAEPADEWPRFCQKIETVLPVIVDDSIHKNKSAGTLA